MKGEFGFDIREAHGGTLFDNEGENEIMSVDKNCLEKKRNETVMACSRCNQHIDLLCFQT